MLEPQYIIGTTVKERLLSGQGSWLVIFIYSLLVLTLKIIIVLGWEILVYVVYSPDQFFFRLSIVLFNAITFFVCSVILVFQIHDIKK